MDKQALSRRDAIRRLNDEFRVSGLGRGSLMLTSGIHEQGLCFVSAAVNAMRSFDAFDRDNDPYDEHDFGAFTLNDQRLFFKFDYYNLTLDGGSDDPADPAKTHRVLTLMLANEY